MRPPTASTLHTSKHKCAMGVQNYLFNVSLAREIPKKFPISPTALSFKNALNFQYP